MKKIITLLTFVLVIVSCTTESANVDLYEAQDINKMSDTEFIAFMENISISRGALPSALNPDDSYYPFPIESIETFGEEKMLIGDPTNGVCVERDINLPGTGAIGNFEIEKFADNNGVSDGSGNGNQKIKFKYTAAPGWYIYSISKNISQDCSHIPFYNGEPDVCSFNVRNCFSGTRTGVTYTFRENCIPDCSCIAAYIVMYTLDEHGSVDQCVGVWADGEQLGMSDTAKTNSFCKDDCGEVQSN